MAKSVTPQHKNLPNPEFSQAMHGLRMSSATDRHQDARNQRARTRSAAKRRAIADWR